MSHIKEITDGKPSNSVSKWSRKTEFHQDDQQNKNQSTFPKTVVKKETNRVNRIISPASKIITKSQSLLPETITMEFREDEYNSGNSSINRVENTSVTMNPVAPATSGRLLFKRSPSEVKTKNESSGKMNNQLIKTTSRFSTYTQLAKKVHPTTSQDANIVRGESSKQLELKESRTCSKAMKQKQVKHAAVSVSEHSRKLERHHSEPIRQHVESTSQRHVIQDINTQTLSIQYERAQVLNTPNLRYQDISIEYRSINILDENINPTAAITHEEFYCLLFVNFVNGFIASIYITIILFVLEIILVVLNFIRYN